MKSKTWVQVLSLAMQAVMVVFLWLVVGGLARGLYETFMLGFTLFNSFPA